MSEVYKASGVDLQAGEDFSAFCGRLVRTSAEFSRFIEVHDQSRGHFRGPRGFDLRNIPVGSNLGFGADGIGTKVLLHNLAGNYCAAGRDLYAMVGSDITRYGGRPIAIGNVLDVRSLGKAGSKTNMACCELMQGLFEVCKEQRVVMLPGETAELGVCVGAEDPDPTVAFNWSAFGMGLYNQNKLITGDTLAPGQVVIALREYGFRSNGISAVRRALARAYGPNIGGSWWLQADAQPKIAEAAVPSTIYDSLLIHLLGWDEPMFPTRIKLHAVAHITGGGIEGKFCQDLLFPRGLSAHLENLYVPPAVMGWCAQVLKEMKPEEYYQVWNGGQGMLVVVDASQEDAFCYGASQFGIEAQKCGHILSETSPVCRIRNQYLRVGCTGPEWIHYFPKKETV